MAARNARPRVRFLRLPHAEGLALPAYQSAGAAGLDLVAALPEDAPVTLRPRGRALIPTGLVLELPAGYEGQVRPRSGLAARHGITVLNSPGTVDADYRGEVQVILVNLGDAPFKIARGERIAQLVIAPVTRANLVAARRLKSTARGDGGFGSTGSATKPMPAVAKKSRATPKSAGRAKKLSAKRS
jgi:dUTP pyrophosphatase